MIENTYIFYRNDQKQAHFKFDPRDPGCFDDVEYKYFGRVLNKLEPKIKNRGLTIYVTAWTVHELPEYGPHVISCILQDEWSREPQYRDKVGMIFRTCGKFPYNTASYKHGNINDVCSNFLGQSKAAFMDGNGRLQTCVSLLRGKKIAPVYNIPLGYYALEDVPYIPILERENDLFFAGSMQHIADKSLKIRRPKELARRRMHEVLDSFTVDENYKIKLVITGSFKESIRNDNLSYIQNMMNTKICPIPRGANLETFRFYEAIRCGCIPVGEAFPNDYFYDDAPIIRLKNWRELKTAIKPLLSDKNRLEEMHQNVLLWWEKVCSEEATAQFMFNRIDEDVSLNHIFESHRQVA